jgi:F0F1-type ATP synthase membrane subunit b/b'
MKVYNAKVDEARKAAEGQVNAALAEMEAEQTEARAMLQGTVGSLADQIAGNILQNLAS